MFSSLRCSLFPFWHLVKHLCSNVTTSWKCVRYKNLRVKNCSFKATLHLQDRSEATVTCYRKMYRRAGASFSFHNKKSSQKVKNCTSEQSVFNSEFLFCLLLKQYPNLSSDASTASDLILSPESKWVYLLPPQVLLPSSLPPLSILFKTSAFQKLLGMWCERRAVWIFWKLFL